MSVVLRCQSYLEQVDQIMSRSLLHTRLFTLTILEQVRKIVTWVKFCNVCNVCNVCNACNISNISNISNINISNICIICIICSIFVKALTFLIYQIFISILQNKTSRSISIHLLIKPLFLTCSLSVSFQHFYLL